jgi:glycosyltransferase involved in cell wall biosynthesis
MKIIFYLEYFPPYQGSDRTIFELSKRMKGRNNHLHYIVIPPLRTLWEFNQLGFKSERFKRFYYQSYILNKKSFTKQDNVYRIQIPLWLLNFWKKHLKIAFVLTFFFNLLKSLSTFNKLKPHIILINHPSPSSGLLAFFLCKIFRKPFLMGFPDMISTYASDLIGLAATDYMSKILKRLETFLLLKSPKIFTINDFLKNYLISLKFNKKNIVVVPNGVDIQVFDYKKTGLNIRNEFSLQNAYIVLYVGHIEKWAGIEQIISAANIIKSTNPEIKFLFVGEGMLYTEFKNLRHENLIFVGLQPYAKVPEFIACSNVAISIFPPSITSHAASPLKVFEYMAMGKPIITTDIAGLKNVLINNKNGIIIPSDDPRLIAEAILNLKNSEQIASGLGENALKTIRRQYTWDESAKKLKSLCTNYIKEYYYLI